MSFIYMSPDSCRFINSVEYSEIVTTSMAGFFIKKSVFCRSSKSTRNGKLSLKSKFIKIFGNWLIKLRNLSSYRKIVKYALIIIACFINISLTKFSIYRHIPADISLGAVSCLISACQLLINNWQADSSSSEVAHQLGIQSPQLLRSWRNSKIISG